MMACARAGQGRVVRALADEICRPLRSGRQRVAQLVGQRRQELVLAAVRLAQRLLGLPRDPGVPADPLRRPPYDGHEQHHLEDGPHGGPEGAVVETGALAHHPQPADHGRQEQQGDQQPAEHDAARIVPPDRREEAVLGHQGHEADPQRRDHGGGLQGHARQPGDREELAGVVEVPDDPQQRDHDGDDRQRAAHPPRPGTTRDEPQAGPQDRKRGRGRRPHAARRGGRRRARGLLEQQGVDPQIHARQVLEQRQPGHQTDPRSQRPGQPNRSVQTEHQQRAAAQQRADGGVGLHRDAVAAPLQQPGRAEPPPEQRQGPADDRVGGRDRADHPDGQRRSSRGRCCQDERRRQSRNLDD